MTTSRFYRPKIAKMARKELAFLEEAEEAGLNYFLSDEEDPIMTREVAARGKMGKGEFHPAYFSIGDFQITYSFSSKERNNLFPSKGKNSAGLKGMMKAYGKKMSFRILYEFLCKTFNGGELFIDTYFARKFETRPVYADLLNINDKIQTSINAEEYALFSQLHLKKDGTPNMWYNSSKNFKDFKTWQDPIIKGEVKKVAKKIQDDIVRCLSTGQIPLRGREGAQVSEATAKIRESMLGLDPNLFFFASGQLIHDLSIYVEIGA